MPLTPATGPLHGYEIAHLKRGRVLIRHSRRYKWILMWLVKP